MKTFANAIINWQKLHGRHNLPWQTKPNQLANPYAIWVSEIMLQQTQVTAVIGYYDKFITRFPNILALASATQEEVLQYWSGLGYYSRARNLHNSAQIIVDKFGGIFPQNFDEILSLPGIGESTAAAISTFAFNQPHPILDGNVKRVFARHFLIEGWPGNPKIEQKMWQIAKQENPNEDAVAYTQGLMDLGATLCTRTRPKCNICPVQNTCIASIQNITHSLPSPKPKKVLPEKFTTMVLMMNAGEVMLEKRPPKGIWGGLWSLPEYDVAPDGQHLEQLTHTFSHFKLHIQPILIQQTNRMNLKGTIWLNLDEAIGAAIPTPVRKVLQSVSKKIAQRIELV